MSDSSGVLSPFLWLHGLHAVVRFSHESWPPFTFGKTWSIVSGNFDTPQY